MIDNLLGDDDETADESDDEEIGGLFDDPGDGVMDGGTEGGDEDLMGDDDLVGDDGMSFDDGGDGGTTNGEMNNRVDELENELTSLSSSVNTVKSENEQISESLDDVEENIRKLLEVYEMVTRGVNPFVDETELGDAFDGGAGGGGDGGSLGLFGDDDQQQAAPEIDESVANADADEFFDDDLEDDDLEDGDLEDGDLEDGDLEDGDLEGDDLEDDVEVAEDDGVDEPSDAGADGANDDDGGSGGGKSFEELKSEYESGDAEFEDDGTGDGEEGADTDGDATVDDVKPYLQELPAGYVADVVVMDWLEFLVDEGGVDGAARTIAYYEAIDWISASAAERLQTYLRGFGDDVESDPEPRSWLTVSHHETSLRFISRIDDPSMEMAVFDEWGGRPRRGEAPGSDSPGTPNPGPGATAHGAPSSARAEYELESDGGRRTPAAEEGAQYEPAVTRRRREEYGGGDDDDGDATDEVGYGGFYWNHGGR